MIPLRVKSGWEVGCKKVYLIKCRPGMGGIFILKRYGLSSVKVFQLRSRLSVASPHATAQRQRFVPGFPLLSGILSAGSYSRASKARVRAGFSQYKLRFIRASVKPRCLTELPIFWVTCILWGERVQKCYYTSQGINP